MTVGNIHNGEGLAARWSELLQKSRGVQLTSLDESVATHPIKLLGDISQKLQEGDAPRESQIFAQVSEICVTSPDYGGRGLSRDGPVTEDDVSEISFLLSAWLESLNSDDRKKTAGAATQNTKPADRPPMNVTEKIFAVHDIDGKGYVKSGETIRVSIDWIMASEASWAGMEKTYDELGEPGIFRNDRFWLAGDHVVDPRVNANPTIKKLIESSEMARKVFKMTEYQGMNYTIMHTEFFRERAQPGMFIIGSDSHTCSSGAVGCLSIGLGAADVTMGLITGEIWFKVPEVINIEFIGKPRRGIGGKDVILYVLQQLRRNTVASDRVVEYTGPGLEYLSPDARFAIANMTTEFGGITGIFAPDHVTKTFIEGRKVARHKNASRYFHSDDTRAVYAESHVIDLSKVESFVAKYPNPDDVVPVTDLSVLDMKLDGCFIGACTTAEEDIIMGALVLEQGMKNGLRPAKDGKKRKVVPGSRPIIDMLRTSGLAAVYEDSGFEVGIPGCSYCVGMSADRAGKDEVWLSSQNRNFENRMGQGSIGNLASAATVAASSFNMAVTNPQSLIDQIPPERWEALKGRGSLSAAPLRSEPDWVEPASSTFSRPDIVAQVAEPATSGELVKDSTGVDEVTGGGPRKIVGKVQRLGDFIDTDALAPAQFLITSRTNEVLGSHCLEFTHPGFRDRAKEGYDIVVAGKAFGCGSSREQAVMALLGCGVKCVIAESFAFIYSRNQPSLGLLGITMADNPAFFAAAQDGVDMEIDLDADTIWVGSGGDGKGREAFTFRLSGMEKELTELGGITPAFLKFGKQLFDVLCGSGQAVAKATKRTHALPVRASGAESGAAAGGGSTLQW